MSGKLKNVGKRKIAGTLSAKNGQKIAFFKNFLFITFLVKFFENEKMRLNFFLLSLASSCNVLDDKRQKQCCDFSNILIFQKGYIGVCFFI
jgi:hypothetical protein